MKKMFRMSLKIRGTEKVLAEGFEPGVFVTQDVIYNIEPDQYERTSFHAALWDKQQEFLKENIEVLMEEIDE